MSAPKSMEHPRKAEPLQALEFIPTDHLTPSTSETTPWWEEKPPTKRILSRSPRHEGTQTLPRGAGRAQGGAPSHGGVPATTTTLSWAGADPQPLP